MGRKGKLGENYRRMGAMHHDHARREIGSGQRIAPQPTGNGYGCGHGYGHGGRTVTNAHKEGAANNKTAGTIALQKANSTQKAYFVQSSDTACRAARTSTATRIPVSGLCVDACNCVSSYDVSY